MYFLMLKQTFASLLVAFSCVLAAAEDRRPLPGDVPSVIGTAVAAGILSGCLCGISHGETSTETPAAAGDPVAEHEAVRQRTTTSFTHAAYFSPVHDEAVGRSVWMAPLVLQEFHFEDGTPEFPKFGAVKVSESGQHTVGTDRPTVYTTARRIRIGRRLYRQDSYLWFYPPAEPGKPLRYRGFRQTLGRNGFPAVRELIKDEPTKRIFFVSKSLERAAALQFGAPLAGRCFSLEPDCSKHPNVVVARVLQDAARPMGPFVYLDSSSLDIPNLKCRCERSQVSEFALKREYHLVPVASFEELPAKRRGTKDVSLPDATQLSGTLRLPNSM